jgi:hypothetical protein
MKGSAMINFIKTIIGSIAKLVIGLIALWMVMNVIMVIALINM